MTKIKATLLMMVLALLYSGYANSTTTFQLTINNNSIYDMSVNVDYDTIRCFNFQDRFDGVRIKTKTSYTNVVEASSGFFRDCLLLPSRLDIENNVIVQIADHPTPVRIFNIHIEKGASVNFVTMSKRDLESLSKYDLCLSQQRNIIELDANGPDYSYSFTIDNC